MQGGERAAAQGRLTPSGATLTDSVVARSDRVRGHQVTGFRDVAGARLADGENRAPGFADDVLGHTSVEQVHQSGADRACP